MSIGLLKLILILKYDSYFKKQNIFSILIFELNFKAQNENVNQTLKPKSKMEIKSDNPTATALK